MSDLVASSGQKTSQFPDVLPDLASSSTTSTRTFKYLMTAQSVN